MENRTSKRIPISLEAYLTRGDETSEAFIGGMSENGLYVIAAPGAKDSADHDAGTLTVKFNISPGQALELKCKVAWSDKRISGHSTKKMGLEIPDPPVEFLKFYKDSYYKMKTDISHDAIAVIGMACYYPGAPDLKSFWENILARRRAFRSIPKQRLPLSEYYDPDPAAPDKTYGNRAAVIDGFEFDWVRRGIPKSVVDSSDIVHWLALEVALRALEDAGYGRGNIPSDRSGVILGNTLTGEHSRSQLMRLRWPYVKKVFKATASRKLPPAVIDELLDDMEVNYKSAFAPITEDTLAGNLSNTIAGRICNFLDLHGGGYTVDGACSSSLIAVATAASALSNTTLDLAVAGGIDISLDSFELVGFAKTNALTREDMKVYDRSANGFIPGEGAGFVVLKRLEDARADGDYVYAVLRGWAISSDGKGAMTAPKAHTQALAIRRAYGKAGYGLSTVDFIEGHGTGTIAGDKAELEGIADAMDGENIDPVRPCGITSLKSLIGHTKAASGIGGFIKTVMAVNRRVIPPTAGCKEPNPVFDDKASRVYPVLEGEIRGADGSIRAGVSGMGFGGINCHVTVESAGEPAKNIKPSVGERELLVSHQETELFVMTAGSQQEMAECVTRLKGLADGISTGEMVDLSMHLAGDVSADKPFRAALIARSPEGLADCLDRAGRMLGAKDIPVGEMVSDPHQDIWVGNSVSRARVGFLFPGQGSQQLNMGRVIMERFAWARDFRDTAESWFSEAGYGKISGCVYLPLDRALSSGQVDGWKETLSRSKIAQPAICMTSLLWMRHLENLGVEPAVVGGHSLGELTAFHAAGAFNDKALLTFAAFRGRETSAPDDNPGVMASFACGRERVEELLKGIEGYVVVANINSPAQTVISGEKPAVEKAVGSGSLLGIKTRYLPVSNAFHSRFMKSAADRLCEHAPIPEVLTRTKVKLLTSIDGGEMTPGTNMRRHFARQVTHGVDFISLVNNIRRECDLLVETGPGRVLSDLVRSITGEDGTLCFPVEPTAGDDRPLNVFLGCYFVSGGGVNWPALFENRLVRPFVPASKRSFIDNPCERHGVPEVEGILHPLLTLDGQPAMAPTIVADDANGLFSSQQIDLFPWMMHDVQGEGLEPESDNGGSTKEAPAGAPAGPGSLEDGDPVASGGVAGPETLLKLASEMTGFPADSISLDHRLLDDLNLDSIKAGQFVAKAVKLYGAKVRQLDPTTMANSSLREIYGRLGLHASSGQPAPGPSGATGDGQPFEAVTTQNADNWVRNFKVSYVEQRRTSRYSLEEILAGVSREKRSVLLVSDDGADSLCSEMRAILTQNGVAASSMDYKGLSGCTPDDYGRYGYFVFLLPRKKGTGLLTGEQACDMASRVHCIGKVITSMTMQIPKPAYAVVQFGSGGFHEPDEGVSLEAKGSTAFLCGIHLENPGEKIRVMEFSETRDAARILREVAGELHAQEGFGMAAFDGGFTRSVPVLELVEPGTFKERKVDWTVEDVVLVTGGAKGITAECALEFAMKKGVKLALAGSTTNIGEDEEIQKVLRRYRENGITYRYYACDISRKEDVTDLKKRIEQDLGTVTGVIHGAAVNRPRRAEQVTLDEAVGEMAPKLIGAINICESLKDNPPKMFVAFGSIIGVTGMKGNTWYGFSNEILNLLLQRFKTHAGAVGVLTCAFSVWGEVGMGARMGSLDFLSRMGVFPIPKEKGVKHFMRLVDNEPGEAQVIVTGRLGGLDYLRKPAPSKPRHARFLEEVLFYEDGVEIEAKAALTLDKDPYLKDHVFKGNYLFPTVFGIEAMAQAVSYVTGIGDIDYLQLENVLLSLPIAVEPDNATEIHVHALVEDTAAEDGSIRVRAGITVDQTQFSRNHFEATFVLGTKKPMEKYAGMLPKTILDISPEEDLYGHMLFQGRMFQRIKSVRSLDDTQCVFDSGMDVTGHGETPSGGDFLTKDPFFRDTLLQSVQIILPDLVALPVEIERWDIFLGHPWKGTHRVVADLLHRDEEIVAGEVAAVDAKGRVVERLRGYKAKIVEEVQDAPRPEDLRSPDGWDEALLNERLQYYCRKAGRTAPVISIRHRSGLHEMKKAQRHAVEKELFGKAYRMLMAADEGLPAEITAAWTKEGKPFVKEYGGVGLSCSHDDRLCLCVVGQGAQGCDMETMTHRTADEWRDLLGTARAPLFEAAAGVDKSADMAGSRIWCALEALRKATDMKGGGLGYAGQIEDCAMFEGGGLSILAFPVKLLRGRERMVAIVTAKKGSALKKETGTRKACYIMEDVKGVEDYVNSGPQGQKVFTYQFPLGLRDSSTVGGGVYFANYFHWLGKAREAALKPIGRYIADEFSGGHFMVTNFTETDILGRVGNYEVIDVRTWIDRMFGNNMVLHFEWLKPMPDGTTKRVASSRHQVSWVRVTGHGVVEPVPAPEFFLNFLRDNSLLPGEDNKALDEEPFSGRKEYGTGLGKILYEGDVLGEDSGILEESIIDTTMEHSNLAQNIYFSNYFTWQGHLRDRYLFNLSPGQYRKMDRHGQFACVHSHVKHLREAMPFDRICVTMKLSRLYERGIDLYFEYFKAGPGGDGLKLAYGVHTLAWVRVDGSDNYVPQRLPAIYTNKILNAAPLA